jgi:hypothetical protein
LSLYSAYASCDALLLLHWQLQKKEQVQELLLELLLLVKMEMELHQLH